MGKVRYLTFIFTTLPAIWQFKWIKRRKLSPNARPACGHDLTGNGGFDSGTLDGRVSGRWNGSKRASVSGMLCCHFLSKKHTLKDNCVQRIANTQQAFQATAPWHG